MPPPAMPPTPVSSTEMKGQDGTQQLSTLQMTFELPPSAIGGPRSSSISPKSAYPVQASETVKSRRRSLAAQKESFALPPPPTRSRKIIQMKPGPQDEPAEPPKPAKTSLSTTTTTNTKAPAAAGTRKKPASSTSAAGRKIARKTAHSLIERRRRSKMNEEFAVLKGLIPACTGEMHKLAILQASIDYVRYLQDCVNQLKSQAGDQSSAHTPTDFVLPPSRDAFEAVEYQGDGGDDVDMTGSEAASPTFTDATSRSQRPSESPALLAQDSHGRHDSYSSVSTDHRHYSYSASSAPSPAFGPQAHSYNRGQSSASNSTLTSPALPPQHDLDQEATAALLMLNTDRRGIVHTNAGRGLSVRDLLST